jgi:uncharacterized protein
MLVKGFWIVLGSLFVALGAIGAVLPLLPTTPFLLLAAACYIRGSERLYHKLTGNRYLGAYIKDYREGRGIPLRSKIVGIVMVWVSISYAAFFVVPILVGKLALFAIAGGVSLHLIRIPTKT